MEANIFHTVNSGLYVLCGDTGVLIDGIHKGYRVGSEERRVGKGWTEVKGIRNMVIPFI